MTAPLALEAFALAPETRNDPLGDDVRLLRRLRVDDGPTGLGDPCAPAIAVVVDVETTGLDRDLDAIIELAVRRFRYDGRGRITKIDRAWSWLEDPGRPLAPDVAKLTGLTDDMLRGQLIDDTRAAALLADATVVIAHNAAFDRPHVERRLPGAAGLPWACSCAEVDWRGNGFDGRSLGHLLMQTGFFTDAHRAGADVDALIGLLGHELPGGDTVLAELVGRSFADGWIVRAEGAAYGRRGNLKARGYRWDGRAWWREVPDEAREAEEWWLAAHVYTAGALPRRLGPAWERIGNRSRWA